jgi:manganese-dependent ADP-ribose/CDP-alcohol diphosphatase
MMSRKLLLLCLLPTGIVWPQGPEFSFGVVADVQYADQATAGKRDYRTSFGRLEHCVSLLSREKLDFVIQLGDLIDRGLDSLDRILPVFNRLPGPRYHVLGNHDLTAGRTAVLNRLGLSSPYYQFEVKRWHFIVLDGMQLSAADPRGKEELARLRAAESPNAQDWNGGLGSEQLRWLRSRLHDATAVGEHAVVFCHFPVLPESSSPVHVLWDYREALKILEDEPATAAYVAGHDHRGGYAVHNGIHYITLPGMVESETTESCRVMDVYPDRLILRNAGQTGGRQLPVRR